MNKIHQNQSTNLITFERAVIEHQNTILHWLAEAHIQEFWDNSQEHKDDIINFINGRKQPSNYFNGIFTYWVGLIDEEPFCFLLTAEVKPDEECPPLWREYLSKTGRTYSIDFCIGNTNHLGKGLAALTLQAFTEFFNAKVDPQADTFYIDPESNNPRAKHVYAKAGFTLAGEYKHNPAYWDFGGEHTYLMVKRLILK